MASFHQEDQENEKIKGDTGVGKTHLLSRYVKGLLPRHNISTIGLEFATKVIHLSGNRKVQVNFWDTAGQEKYKSIISRYYRSASGAIIVYDVTNERSFENVKGWLEEIRNSEANPVLILIGNKLDICDDNPGLKKVSKEDAAIFAQENGMLFGEASALTNHKVNELFEKHAESRISFEKGIVDEKGIICMQEPKNSEFSLKNEEKKSFNSKEKECCC